MTGSRMQSFSRLSSRRHIGRTHRITGYFTSTVVNAPFLPWLPLRITGLRRNHPIARDDRSRAHPCLHPRPGGHVTPLIEVAGRTKHFPVRAGSVLHRHRAISGRQRFAMPPDVRLPIFAA
jgi:hypothetical protein